MLFDNDQVMMKPEKSQLIRDLEDKLKSDEYSYHHKPESAFVIDVVVADYTSLDLQISPVCCHSSHR